MSKGQLAILPVQEGRSVERRVVNLAARLRDPGATLVEAEVLNLSISGFMAETEAMLAVGDTVWLKISGLEAQQSRVAWTKDGRIGCEFATHLYPLTIEMLVQANRKPIPKGHFGRQA